MSPHTKQYLSQFQNVFVVIKFNLLLSVLNLVVMSQFVAKVNMKYAHTNKKQQCQIIHNSCAQWFVFNAERGYCVQYVKNK
jgi:hypothetical protein